MLISNYIIQKVKRICENYEGFDYPSDITAVEAFLKRLSTENSHITFKLKQAIFFIIHNVYPKTDKTFFDEQNKIVSHLDFTLNELLDWMGNPEYQELINHLPPSVFSIDIEMESISGETSTFNRLSSGEQQFIHVIPIGSLPYY